MHRAIRTFKTFTGLALMLFGHGLLASLVRDTIFGPLRSAVPITSIDPSLDGQVVAISGPTATESELEDPDYLWPQPLVVLERVLDQPHLDSDDELQWSRVESLGRIHSMRWVAKEVRIGGLRFVPADATFDSVPVLAVAGESVRRVVPPGVRRASWDAELGLFYTSPDEFQGFETLMSKSSGTLRVTGIVRFEGFRTQDDITVVGRQAAGSLVPFAYGDGDKQALFVLQGNRTPEQAAQAVERKKSMAMSGSWALAVVLALFGTVMVFMHPVGVGMWFMFCGAGHFFGTLAGFGWEEALPHLALTVGAWGAVAMTFALASTSAGWMLVVPWLVLLGAAVAAIRLRMSEAAVAHMEELL